MNGEPTGATITVREVVVLTQRVETLLELSEKHERIFYGTNGDTDKGVLTRLTRLEDAERDRQKAENERSSDLKKFFMPVLQQIFSLGAGALMLLIIQHYYVP